MIWRKNCCTWWNILETDYFTVSANKTRQHANLSSHEIVHLRRSSGTTFCTCIYITMTIWLRSSTISGKFRWFNLSNLGFWLCHIFLIGNFLLLLMFPLLSVFLVDRRMILSPASSIPWHSPRTMPTTNIRWNDELWSPITSCHQTTAFPRP